MRPDILTCGGRYFPFLEPDTAHFSVPEIAHALSNICRFTGHTREFYSVAQHSVIVSHLVPRQHALHALLHDAAEAYLGDVAKPLKHCLSEYKAIERGVEAALFRAFGLPAELPECIKHADLIMLATEQRDLMPHHDDEWACIAGIEPLREVIKPMLPGQAEYLFLHRYEYLASIFRADHHG